jgi:mRNA interferase MazF
VGKDYSGGMEIIWIFLKEVRFGLYPKDSKVKCNQIRTIDKKRLINFVSALLPEKLEKVEKALLIHLNVN